MNQRALCQLQRSPNDLASGKVDQQGANELCSYVTQPLPTVAEVVPHLPPQLPLSTNRQKGNRSLDFRLW